MNRPVCLSEWKRVGLVVLLAAIGFGAGRLSVCPTRPPLPRSGGEGPPAQPAAADPRDEMAEHLLRLEQRLRQRLGRQEELATLRKETQIADRLLRARGGADSEECHRLADRLERLAEEQRDLESEIEQLRALEERLRTVADGLTAPLKDATDAAALRAVRAFLIRREMARGAPDGR